MAMEISMLESGLDVVHQLLEAAPNFRYEEPIDSNLRLCSYCRYYILRSREALKLRDDPECPSCGLISSVSTFNDLKKVEDDIRTKLIPYQTADAFANKFEDVAVLFRENPTTLKSKRAESTLYLKTQHDDSPDHIGEMIDFTSCMAWLERCKHDHGPECERQNLPQRYSTPINIILVDVFHNCITKTTTASTYFALSYVWGASVSSTTTSQNFGLLQQPGSLDTYLTLPKTVTDAILFTREMGVRYLWVDCICIVQDSAEKHQDFANMDVIFSQAELTIIAASSEDANSGLPGVRRGTRRRRITSKAQGNNILQLRFPEDRDPILQGTVYETRAWIFQELLVSRRLVFVTEYQIVFHCDRSHRSESIPQERLHELSRIGFGHTNLHAKLSLKDSSNKIVESYVTMVKEYSQKKLSFQADIENAFAGLASILEYWCEDNPVIHGMVSSFFGYSIIWFFEHHQSYMSHYSESEVGQRREGFPSWSWMGWVACISYIDEKPWTWILHSQIKNVDITIYSEDTTAKSIVVTDQSASEDEESTNGQQIRVNLKPQNSDLKHRPNSTLSFDAERIEFKDILFERIGECNHLVTFNLPKNTPNTGLGSNTGFLYIIPDGKSEGEKFKAEDVRFGCSNRSVPGHDCDWSIVRLYQMDIDVYHSLLPYVHSRFSASKNRSSEPVFWEKILCSGVLFIMLIRRRGVYWERIGSGVMLSDDWPSTSSQEDIRAYQERIVLI